MKIYRLANEKATKITPEDLYKDDNIDSFKNLDAVAYRVRDEEDRMLTEYFDRKRKKGTPMSWQVIPKARVMKIWQDFARDGFVRDERGMDYIANLMLVNLAKLTASTALCGHEKGLDVCDKEEMCDRGFKPINGKNYDFFFNYFSTKHGEPLSDYGLNKLWKFAEKLAGATDYTEKIMLVDQMLSVVHQRGDLAALFVEGGRAFLEELKNWGTNNENL